VGIFPLQSITFVMQHFRIIPERICTHNSKGKRQAMKHYIG
jgi:hypothetical protein